MDPYYYEYPDDTDMSFMWYISDNYDISTPKKRGEILRNAGNLFHEANNPSHDLKLEVEGLFWSFGFIIGPDKRLLFKDVCVRAEQKRVTTRRTRDFSQELLNMEMFENGEDAKTWLKLIKETKLYCGAGDWWSEWERVEEEGRDYDRTHHNEE